MVTKKEGNIEGERKLVGENTSIFYTWMTFVLVSDSASSAQVLLDKVDLFSQISGYKVNWHKSEAMAVSNQTVIQLC